MDETTLRLAAESLFEALEVRMKSRPLLRLALPEIQEEATEAETIALALRLYKARQRGGAPKEESP
jgi:hypothetical protein